MPSSGTRFQIQAFLFRSELCLDPSRFPSLELINYIAQARDARPLINAMDIDRTYEGGAQESGSVCFETTTEYHVALDVHAIVQKWNGCCFVSRA